MASGNTLLIFNALANEPPAANFATFDTRNSHPVLDFDDTTDEAAVFSATLPRNYLIGGLTISIHWAATSATTGTCRWEASVERIGAAQQDMDADGFASTQSAGSAANGTSGNIVVTTITFTDGAQMDSIAVGEGFRLKINRDANGTTGTDDMVGDAELRFVEVKET